MPMLIDASELWSEIQMLPHNGDMISDEEVEQVIAGAKTIDAVPVVRCRDCKLWHEETGFCEKNSYFVDGDGVYCSPAESPNWTMFDPDDFCSYGKRKEGADHEP